MSLNNRELSNGKVIASMLLTSGKDGNFHHWRKTTVVELQKVLGDVANVMKTDKATVIPPVVEADYTPDGEPVDPATLVALRTDAEKSRMRQVRELKKNYVPFYASLLSLLSPGSRDLVERHAGFAANDLVMDPNVLWSMIRETHATNTTGTSQEQILSNKVLMQMEFNDMRQGKTSIIEFKELFLSKWKTLLSNGVHEIDEAELALVFLYKLDKGRYGQMMVDLANDALKGVPYPKTVLATYVMAANRQEYSASTSSNSGMHTVYTLSEDKYGGTKASGGRGRGRSSRGAGRGRGRGGTSDTGATTVKATSAVTGSQPAEEPTDQGKQCYYCKGLNHIRANCPKLAHAPVVAVVTKESEYDDYGDYDDFDSTVAMFQEVDTPHVTETVLSFRATEVLLDSQGGKSVFKEQSLLHDVIVLHKPYTLAGIDGGRKKGLTIQHGGYFRDFAKLGNSVGCSSKASANVLSMAECVDRGYKVEYSCSRDEFELYGDEMMYVFKRRTDETGRKSKHYIADMEDYQQSASERILVETVAENMTSYSKREIDAALTARSIQENHLGHMSTKAFTDIINAGGILNCSVTAQDLLRADAMLGKVSSSKGKTKKMASVIANVTLLPRVIQQLQSMFVDLFFVKGIIFLVALLEPLGLILICHLKDKSTATIKKGLDGFIDKAKSRSFDVQVLLSDGEGGIQSLTSHLNHRGITVDPAGPGSHVKQIERCIQTIKGHVRSFENSLPYVMNKSILMFCVLFCVSTMNLMIPTSSELRVSPMEQFSGRKVDMKRDLRFGFGDYVQATVPNTNNSMGPRTEGCIALLSRGNLLGSVYMYHIGTSSIVTRDQFKIFPMNDLAISVLTARALADGFTRGSQDPGAVPIAASPLHPIPAAIDVTCVDQFDVHPLLDEFLAENAGVVEAKVNASEPPEYLPDDPVPIADQRYHLSSTDSVDVIPESVPAVKSVEQDHAEIRGGGTHRYGTRLASGTIPYRGAPASKFDLVVHEQNEESRRELRRQLALRQNWRDTDFAFTISVKMALRERGEEARPVIMAELQQMVDKRVWHGMHVRNLSHEQRKRIIRSSMFLKDKYLASGAFDRFKARLVAGGDMQDKSLYDELSSPTAATSSVLAVAAVAANEFRQVITVDIGGAFLNAHMPATGVKVHMRLDKVMTQLLLKIDPSYESFLEQTGTVVVELDKALYGCVEAASLWYEDLKRTIKQDGFIENPYDHCVFNKLCADKTQMTIVLHVDDLMITNLHDSNLEAFYQYLKTAYKETKIVRGRILDYVGMTFDFSSAGEVKITMENCVNEILAGCGVSKIASTPASPILFDIRDSPKVSKEEAKWFHSYTAKLLYLSKRIRPECLTTVAFLTTRVAECDQDDLGKLRRLLAYVRGTRERGIILRIGVRLEVRTYIDAAYGVHTTSGKSHTGCAVVLGDGGPVYNKSTKQKIVTKSSTEAELVGLSDSVSQSIHMRNFLIAQGYTMGPVIVHQDNLSCMALIKKGGPCSERSRHINIRYFWLCSKVDNGEILIVHLGTELMFANVLTKPVQGSSFIRERDMLTNWK